jgi:A/G-specific adenine glycosylase
VGTVVGYPLPAAWTNSFSALALRWFEDNARDFPWRNTTNAFHILIAETLLRQTQAKRVVDPYLYLSACFPNPHVLANANVKELRDWFKPLGLVNRADRLVKTADCLVHEYQGLVPNDLEALVSLPGLGAYSARAIMCLAFDEPVPMIDGSSGRLLRRMLGRSGVSPAYCDITLIEIASSVVPRDSPKQFNLALLDIAAAYCHPRKPICSQCPLKVLCSRAHTLHDSL